MQPKTKAQKAICAIQSRLLKITEDHIKWAKNAVLDHVAVRLKNGKITCLDCGHSWNESLEAWKLNITGDNACPGCGVKLNIADTKKQKFYEWQYFNVITTFKGWQVIRLCKISGHYKSGHPAQIYVMEIGQMWFDGKKRFDFGLYSGYGGNWCGGFELRAGFGGYSFDCKNYPKIKVLPEIKKRGFKGGFHGMYPITLFRLLFDSMGETLFKAKQYSLFSYMANEYRAEKVFKHWPSVKIAMRNKYVIKDAGIWIDYLDLLLFFNKDLRNAKYVCPENLKSEHDRYVAKKRALDRKQAEVERRKAEAERRNRMEEEQREYEKAKAAFFGLCFQQGDLVVKVIDTVQGFASEGDTHKHCVYTNEYYKKPDSLVLSAQVNGTPVETVEVSLSEMKVVQARGRSNQPTQYHADIVDLVTQNINQIKKISKVA